jgi:hypothetical protein
MLMPQSTITQIDGPEPLRPTIGLAAPKIDASSARSASASQSGGARQPRFGISNGSGPRQR